MSPDDRFTIEEVTIDGSPIAPEHNARLFVSQCGVIVRYTILITILEWNKPKADGVSYLEDRCRNNLWNMLMKNFTLPLEVDPENKVIETKVKKWALKKVAGQFKDQKKDCTRSMSWIKSLSSLKERMKS